MTAPQPNDEVPQHALAMVATVVYGLFVISAVLWFWLRDRQHRLPELAIGEHSVFWALAVGAGVGLTISGVLWLLVRYLRPFAALEDRLTNLVGRLTESEIVVIALASAIGEEMLFRGAIQDQAGLWVTTVIFGLLHTGPGLWLWTGVALLLGLLFGLMVQYGFGLLSVSVAHALINFISLRRMVSR